MKNFQDIFETCKQSFISAFLICMTVPLSKYSTQNYLKNCRVVTKGKLTYDVLFALLILPLVFSVSPSLDLIKGKITKLGNNAVA